MFRLSIFALSVVSSLVFGSCATIVGGTSQTISIDSNVKNAEVVVDGVVVGKTPFVGSIKRSKTTSVSIRKAGYNPRTTILNTEVEPIFWGNIIVGGFFGSTTDLASGAMYKYTPASINMDLEPEESETPPKKS